MENAELLLPNQIIKSKRKSISLVIKNNGDFIVRAPLQSKESNIFKFINQKASWIVKKRTEQLANVCTKLSFQNTENISLLGKSYELVYSNSQRVKLTENQIIVPNFNTQSKLTVFLKKFALSYITERVKRIAQAFNFQYASVSISSAKSCWGSCSFNNRLHFTYKLMLCPPDVVDYIVIHELCHTKVKNHSNKFWALVESCCPQYKAQEKWLKVNRAIVELI